MTKTFTLLFLFLGLVSCPKNQEQRQTSLNHKHSKKKSEQLPQMQEDVPKEARSWDADVYLVNFNEEQEAKVMKAITIIKRVISSEEFKERVLNYAYDGKKGFFGNEGMTNEEVYQKILEGAEKMGNTSKNNIMDVELELYHQKTNTIGYTYPNTVRIWMNMKYFTKYTPIKVADNLMHEWMHKLGFTHAVTWSQSRDHSVPYAIGYLVEELAEKYQ